MHVTTFWSYSECGSTLSVRNSLTGKEVLCPDRALDWLETICESGRAPKDANAQVIQNLREASILFDTAADGAAWLDKWERNEVRSYPTIDQIELTNRCPYRCEMCPRTSAMTRSLGDMPIELYKAIVLQIAGHQCYVGLHHFGESLVHRNLANAVAFAREHGVRTGLSCNPPSLKPRMCHRLIDAGLSSMVLSLDSLDAQTYRAIRGQAADLHQAKANIDTLLDARARSNSDLHITLQLIQMRRNAEEAENFLKYCASLKVDRGVVVRLGRWDFDNNKVAELGEFDAPLYADYCRRPWQSLVVLWDGRVVPCCHDYNGAEVIGDLRAQSLEDVWNSAAARRFRTAPWTSSLCRTCAFSRPFREQSRIDVAFRAFHRSRCAEAVLEYRAPETGPLDFDGFDVVGT